MPSGRLVPVLAYPSVSDAVAWLTEVFEFTLRWQVGEHRAQLSVGDGAGFAIAQGAATTGTADHLMVRVEDADAHRARVVEAGGEAGEVQVFPYGEKQYVATDHAGRTWVFSESVDDVDPAGWGARVGDLD